MKNVFASNILTLFLLSISTLFLSGCYIDGSPELNHPTQPAPEEAVTEKPSALPDFTMTPLTNMAEPTLAVQACQPARKEIIKSSIEDLAWDSERTSITFRASTGDGKTTYFRYSLIENTIDELADNPLTIPTSMPVPPALSGKVQGGEEITLKSVSPSGRFQLFSIELRLQGDYYANWRSSVYLYDSEEGEGEFIGSTSGKIKDVVWSANESMFSFFAHMGWISGTNWIYSQKENLLFYLDEQNVEGTGVVAISADGQYILFNKYNKDNLSYLFSSDKNSSTRLPISSVKRHVLFMENPERILLIHRLDDKDQFSLSSYDIKTGEITRITDLVFYLDTATSPTLWFSPDGRWLVYMDSRTGSTYSFPICQ